MAKGKVVKVVEPRLANKLESFGRMAAFLDTFDGRPLDGILEYFRKSGFVRKEELECIRTGYEKGQVYDRR